MLSDFKNHEFPLWRTNHGWRARIGVIHPGGGEGHIRDFYKIAPEGVAISSTGVPNVKDESAASMLHFDEHVIEASQLLARSNETPPDVIAWCCTAGSFLKGFGHDKKLIKEMQDATKITCTTTTTGVVAALRELDIKKICMITPYPHEVNQIEKQFLEDHGFDVVKADGFDLVDVYIIINLSPNAIYRAVKSAFVGEADGIFISCTALDVLDIIEPLEQDLGKPVITSIQASYWHAFKLAKVGTPIKGFGTLLDRPR